ncbi:HNH endonuclease [Blastococcus sp. CT_GayMR16]|nr:HNH endonuclease [Blastococcus sp. CT_GayMR16]
MTPAERVAARSVPGPGGCLLWTGARSDRGYGTICITEGGRKRWLLVHRVAYEAVKGPIPAGTVVRHCCDVRHCVAAEHLISGSYSDNTQDMLERDRQPEHMRRRLTCRKCGARNWRETPQGGRVCRPCTAARQRIRKARTHLG